MKNFDSIRAISELFVIGIVYFCIAHLINNALFGIKPVCSFCPKKFIYIPIVKQFTVVVANLNLRSTKKENAMTIHVPFNSIYFLVS